MHGSHDNQIPREIDTATGLPIGPRMAHPEPARQPERIVLEGRYCRLEPIDPARHRDELFAASNVPDAPARFRYLFDDAPGSLTDFDRWLAKAHASDDPLMFAVISRRTGRVEGRQTLMRITPAHQAIEIGNIYWGPALAQTAAATEANFLFVQYVFEQLGYRRYEWKCDALNAPSRRAAERFGFTYEGHFRRAIINKGRTRDTTWYSIINDEWPALKKAYLAWLDPHNFEANGQQRTRLSDLTSAALRGLRKSLG